MPDKILQEIASIEIKKMIGESNAVGAISHPYLKGKIREMGFGKLLARFLPPIYSIGSGKIHDSEGVASPESDLIIYNPSMLPPLSFSEDLGIYPLESTHYSIEVKSKNSTTRASIIDSINNVKSLRRLTFLNNYASKPIRTYPVSAFFSYGANSKIDILGILKENDEAFDSNPLLNPICIVGQGYWFLSHWEGRREWIHIHANDEHYEILALIGGIVNTLTPANRPLYGYYLLKPMADTEHTIIHSS